jgi:predicted CxxxxCH...CXXCH cytochrome family protein
MTSNKRSFRKFRNPIGCLILLAAFAAAAGCSTAETTGGSGTNVNHILPSGSSVSGWLATPSGGTHASTATLDYIAGNGSSGCAQCHGSDLSGGISGVSCFGNPAGCHHDPVANWTSPTVHGATAKKAPGSSGFASCQICHGSNFSGGGAQVPCSRCHVVNAPHPSQWSSADTYKHSTTDPGNASVCAQCHRNSNPGTPGCFNNTLCHGAGVPHPLDNAWVTTSPPQPHGNAAKATPSSTAGFAYCQICHGTGTTPPANFGGGSSGQSCYDCHSPAPHPSQWNSTDTYKHSTSDPGNAAVCAQCHQSAAGTPGCFNNTLCHGAGGAAHPVPYNDNTHYQVNTTEEFNASCVNCHDITSTKVGPACQTCHVAASPLSAANCTSCHASPPNNPATTAYPNVAGAHNAHLLLDTPSNPNGTPVSCSTCHNGLTSGTDNHYARAKSRVPPGDVAFLSTYNAQSGASSFVPNLFTCANVSCHGGTTPNWRSSVIDVTTNCTICHAQGTTQYNSYYSGEHSRHINEPIACTECHDMSASTTGGLNHFNYLSTTSLRDLGVNTVSSTFRSTTGIAYTPPSAIPGTGTCSGTCHGKDHSNEAWSIPR